MSDVIVDCTELYSNPVHTGIQRVVREMLRHWPASGPELHLARFERAGLVGLSDRVRRLLTGQAGGAGDVPYTELVRQLREASAEPVQGLPAKVPVLIPEVFYDAARARFHIHRTLAENTLLAMLAYDFLPFLRPELFKIRSAAPLMGYLRTIQAASSVAHISAQTAREFAQRVMHGRDSAPGPVLPLGADGLAIERQQWREDRHAFVALGSLDGRKNQHVIVAAFRRLWQAGHQVPLVLIGSTLAHIDQTWLREALAFPQFRWLDKASDADIARELRQARATIYVSTTEGYGLPPVESLAAGIPVIASAEIPSLAMLPADGQCRLPEVTATAIADAVLALQDNAAAARLWAAASSVRLSTWREFGRNAAEWIAGLPAAKISDPKGVNSHRVVGLSELVSFQTSFEREVDRIDALANVYIELPPPWAHIASIDPFSPRYVQEVTRWLETITGRSSYDPARDELAIYLEDRSGANALPFVPSIYRLGSSAFLGEMLQSFGGVLKALDVREGQSVLEYGPGDGQIALTLARMGCDVVAVDIEQRYLNQIAEQAAAMGTQIRTIQGPFGTAEPGRRYDRILFFEAFHHALAHHDLVRTLRDQLAPGGFIVFAGEPILAVDNYFRCTLPYAWGPRLDGLSVQAMRNCGWCELGFTREYFLEMLMRAGFVVTFHENPTTSRGSAYKAALAGATLDLGGPILIEAVGMPDCWYPGEGSFRFMRAPVAGLPIDGASGWKSASLELQHHHPLICDLKMALGSWETRVVLQPGESRRITMPVPAGGGLLRLEGPVHRPCDLSPSSKDDRTLGVSVRALCYYDTAVADS